MNIDIDELVPRSRNFRWKELLWLPRWGVHVIPTDRQYLNLLSVVESLEEIRSLFGGVPMTVTSGLRPALYNKLIRGATFSRHRSGEACDFMIFGMSSDKARKELKSRLGGLGIRVEDKDTLHVHMDIADPGPRGKRYFKP